MKLIAPLFPSHQVVHPPKRIFRVSNSELSFFKTCKRMWDLAGDNRMRMRPKRPIIYFWLGKAIHYSLEKYYDQGAGLVNSFKDYVKQTSQLFGDDTEQLNRMVDLGIVMLKHYKAWAADKDDFRVLRAETPLETPVPGVFVPATDEKGNWYPELVSRFGIDPFKNPLFWQIYREVKEVDKCIQVPLLFVGQTDMQIERMIKSRPENWLMEHKTRTGLLPAEILDVEEQTPRYNWAINQMAETREGWHNIQGVIYNVLFKYAPDVPRFNPKTGRLMISPKKTTEEIVRATIKAYKLDAADYEPVLMKLHDQGNRFFARLEVRRSTKHLHSVGLRLAAECRDLLSFAKARYLDASTYPHRGEHCIRCFFKGVCNNLQQDEGASALTALDSWFTQADHRGVQYGESEFLAHVFETGSEGPSPFETE